MTEPTVEQLVQWQDWLAARPERVREVAERLPPWKTYLLSYEGEMTGQKCSIMHYDEHDDGSVTLTIHAWRDWNPFDQRKVFGVSPENMHEMKEET